MVVTISSKINTVLNNNSFFKINPQFDKEEQKIIRHYKKNLLKLKQLSQTKLTKSDMVNFIQTNPDGLKTLLTLSGISEEKFQRLIHVMRNVSNKSFATLLKKSDWPNSTAESEWKVEKIQTLAKNNRKIALGITNLFFLGHKNPFLKKKLPLIELQKLNKNRINFSLNNLLETIIAYKIKGSSAAKEKNNAVSLIKKILDKNKIKFDYETKVDHIDRKIDFAIPNKTKPKILIESSFLTTTSSGMGDKAKTELNTAAKGIRKYYRNCKFIGFLDGAGWYVRKSDLKTMVKSYSDVFTFAPPQLRRFESFLKSLKL